MTPAKKSTTKTSVLIEWEAPTSNGCPISSYEIIMDDGNGGTITNVYDAANVANKPSLREYTISGLT